MLDEASYQAGMVVYLGAGALVVLLMGWWLRRWLHRSWPLWSALAAALLLTPAYADESASTMAPALIVAGFEMLTHGPDAAAHAVRPLAISLAAAAGLGHAPPARARHRGGG